MCVSQCPVCRELARGTRCGCVYVSRLSVYMHVCVNVNVNTFLQPLAKNNFVCALRIVICIIISTDAYYIVVMVVVFICSISCSLQAL